MKIRYCGFSNSLNYQSKSSTVFDIKAKTNENGEFNCQITCPEIQNESIEQENYEEESKVVSERAKVRLEPV